MVLPSVSSKLPSKGLFLWTWVLCKYMPLKLRVTVCSPRNMGFIGHSSWCRSRLRGAVHHIMVLLLRLGLVWAVRSCLVRVCL